MPVKQMNNTINVLPKSLLVMTSPDSTKKLLESLHENIFNIIRSCRQMQIHLVMKLFPL